jgi:hypothetical protein
MITKREAYMPSTEDYKKLEEACNKADLSYIREYVVNTKHKKLEKLYFDLLEKSLEQKIKEFDKESQPEKKEYLEFTSDIAEKIMRFFEAQYTSIEEDDIRSNFQISPSKQGMILDKEQVIKGLAHVLRGLCEGYCQDKNTILKDYALQKGNIEQFIELCQSANDGEMTSQDHAKMQKRMVEVIEEIVKDKDVKPKQRIDEFYKKTGLKTVDPSAQDSENIKSLSRVVEHLASLNRQDIFSRIERVIKEVISKILGKDITGQEEFSKNLEKFFKETISFSGSNPEKNMEFSLSPPLGLPNSNKGKEGKGNSVG